MHLSRAIVFFCLMVIPMCAFTQQPMAAEALFEKGLAEWRNREYWVAQGIFDELLGRHPHYYEAFYYRASSKEQMGDLHGAYLDYRIYNKLSHNSTEGLLNYAIVCFNLKYFDESRDTFEKLLQTPAGPTNRLFYQMDDSGEGVSNIFTTQGNVDGLYHYYLGRIEHMLGNYRLAISQYDSAVVLQPQKPDYYIDRAETLRLLEMRDLYERDLRKALALEPGNQRANYLMGRLMEGADPETAMDYYSESIAATPNNPAPYRQRGFNRLKSGDLQGALKDFSKAIALNPEEVTSYINRGIILEKMGNYEAAITDHSVAIDLEPANPKAYLNRGNVLYKIREYEDALNDYTVALFYEPDYTNALYQRGLTYYRLGNRPAACDDLQRAKSESHAMYAYRKICLIN